MLPRLSSNTPKKGKYAASTVPSSGSECYWITLGCQESAPSPYLGCNRIEAVITIPRKKATVDSSSTRERRATGGEKKKKEEPPRKIKEQNTRALLGEAKKRPEPTKTPKDIEAEIIHASPSSACASKDDIGQIAREWVVQSHAFSTILEDTADEDGGTFIHARILSTVFGFADDLFMSIQDAEDGSGISVRAQGQLRLGVSDIGVNARRNKKFLQHLQQACM
eukprot:jgi/Picre1/34273/NNA_001747.t2